MSFRNDLTDECDGCGETKPLTLLGIGGERAVCAACLGWRDREVHAGRLVLGAGERAGDRARDRAVRMDARDCKRASDWRIGIRGAQRAPHGRFT